MTTKKTRGRNANQANQPEETAMNSITVCSSDKLNYTPESGFTYTDTDGEKMHFTDADSFRNWWYSDNGPDLGEDVENFLNNPW